MKPTKTKLLVTIVVLVFIAIPVSLRIDTVLAIRKLKSSIGKPLDSNLEYYEVITDSNRAKELMDFVGITQKPDVELIHIPGEGFPYYTAILLVDSNTQMVVEAKVKEMW